MNDQPWGESKERFCIKYDLSSLCPQTAAASTGWQFPIKILQAVPFGTACFFLGFFTAKNEY